jgi:hypothetical protein
MDRNLKEYRIVWSTKGFSGLSVPTMWALASRARAMFQNDAVVCCSVQCDNIPGTQNRYCFIPSK